jgi:predicted Zn-dependent protease
MSAAAQQQVLAEVCDQVLELVGDRVHAIVQARGGVESLTRFANSRIHQNVSEDALGLVLEVTVDGRSAAAAGNQLDREALAALVERALAAARLRPVDPQWPGLAPPSPAAEVDHYDAATADATPEDRARIVKAFVDAGAGLEAAGSCSSHGVARALASSTGQRLGGLTSSAVLSGIHRTATSDGTADRSSIRLADLDGERAGRVAAEKARAAADALDLEPGSYEVVLEPRCLSNMLQFLGSLGFNAKAVAEGTSFVHVGDAQFDQSVSIWDDAADPRTFGLPYDPEGTPTQRVDLVRNGVTTGFVHDRRTAKAAGAESTGHATGSAAFGPVPQSVFFGGGERSPDDLVASMERGLLVTDFWYTRILDPKTQVVTGLTRNGVFLVEDGKVKNAVKNLRFTQSFVAALGPGKVLGLGNDAQLVGGRHVPTVHLASWSFTGGAKG